MALLYRLGKYLLHPLRSAAVKLSSLYLFTMELDGTMGSGKSAIQGRDGADPITAIGLNSIEFFDRATGAKSGHIYFACNEAYVQEIERNMQFDGLYIYKLFVSPEFRNRGLAKMMINTAVEEALRRREGQLRKVHALVEIDNAPSRRAFAAMGFVPTKQLLYLRLGKWRRLKIRSTYRDREVASGYSGERKPMGWMNR